MSLISSTSSALLGMALDATSMRHKAIAQNIANLNTPDYQRVTVNFAAHMQQARQNIETAKSGVNNYHLFPSVDIELGEPESVSMEKELTDLSENTLQHQVLLKALSKHYAMLGVAISEGKR